MKTKIDSFEDIIFENRNKEYGAYELRRKYSKRGTMALIVAIVIVSFAVGVPLIAGIASLKGGEDILDTSASVFIPGIPEEKIPIPPPPPKTPETREMIFRAPKIVDELTDSTDFGTNDEFVLNANSGNLDTNTIVFNFEKPKEKEIIDDYKIYDQVTIQEQPKFPPDGNKSLLLYLAENTKYPVIAQENGIEGTVYVRFVVTKTGEIGQAIVMREVDPLLEEEALRVVKSLPKWTPGKNNGNPVNVWFIIPVRFKLQ